MAELFSLPRARPLTAAGKVRPGSKLTFTLVGSLTEAAIYTDAACTIEHDNPVVADANGEFAAIYMNGDRDVYLTTADDAAVWGPISYKANAGPNSVSVLDYDADASGVADSADAFQDALDALGTTGGTLLVPKGTYKIASGLTFPKTPDGFGLRIIGDSPGATKLNFTGTGYLFTIGDGDGSFSSFFNTIEDLSMYGNGAVGQSGALKLNSAYFWRVKNCIIRDFTTASARGIYGNTSPNYHGEVSLTQFRNVPTGIYFEGSGGIGANSNLIRHNWFGVHSAEAIQLDGVSGNVIENNEFNGSTTTAIRITNNCDGSKIVQNQFDGPTNGVVFTTNTSPRTLIHGNTGGDGVTTGVISGRGTNTIVMDTVTKEIWGSDGLIIGDISNPSTSSVPLTVQATTAMTADAFVVQNAAAQYLLKVNKDGAAEVYQNLTTHGQTVLGNDITNNSNVATITNVGAGNANSILVLKGATSQTGNAIEIQNVSGTVLALVTAAGRIHFGATTAAPGIMSGTGTPEGAVAAPIGSLFLRTDGGAATSLYVKQTGTGNTGWVGK